MKTAEREIIREFLGELAQEEAMLCEELASDKLGISLRSAINELDWYNWNYLQQQDPTEAQEEQYYLIRLGAARLVRLMLRLHDSFPFPALTFRRQKGPYRKVLTAVSHLGFIQHGRRISELAFTGRCFPRRGDAGRFEFVLPTEIINHGAVEDDVTSHFERETARIRHESLKDEAGQNLRNVVDELLTENVFVFREHFMGYNADTLLDEFYFEIAWSDLRNATGFDSFNERLEFGGIPYLKYTLASAFVNSLCLKHEAFCGAMVRKHPAIRMEDILTISADRAGFIVTIREALNLVGRNFLHYTTTTEAEAEQIFETISLTRKNAVLLDDTAAILPCIIEFAQGGIIKCISGRHRQMEFLLRSLRQTYPHEYNEYQQLREGSFQTAIESLLNGSFPDLEMRRNVRLRKDGRELTDVDLAVFDRQQGSLMLIQLKFQDSAASSFKVDASRMERFREETLRWLETVNGWIDSSDERTLRSTFRVPRGTRINRILKLVLGRHHAWSLRTAQLDSDTSFATWNQFLNTVMLIKKRQGDFRTLGGIHKTLRTHIVDAPHRHHRNQEPVEYVLDRLKFAVVQGGSDVADASVSAEALTS